MAKFRITHYGSFYSLTQNIFMNLLKSHCKCFFTQRIFEISNVKNGRSHINKMEEMHITDLLSF